MGGRGPWRRWAEEQESSPSPSLAWSRLCSWAGDSHRLVLGYGEGGAWCSGEVGIGDGPSVARSHGGVPGPPPPGAPRAL